MSLAFFFAFSTCISERIEYAMAAMYLVDSIYKIPISCKPLAIFIFSAASALVVNYFVGTAFFPSSDISMLLFDCLDFVFCAPDGVSDK